MLTARGEEIDRIIGLTVGADDYLVKPFSPRELVARVKAMLRRGRPARTEAPRIEDATLKALAVDPGRRTVRVDGHPVELTALEFNLLAVLARDPGIVIGRQALLDAVWGPEYLGDDHLVDVHIANLRRKLGDDPARPRFVETVRGVGYRLREAADAAPALAPRSAPPGVRRGRRGRPRHRRRGDPRRRADYFSDAMGHVPGDPMGEAMGVATQAAFEAMPRALVAATVIALVSADVVSLAVAARIASPVRTMAAAARRIAGGHYDERVPVASRMSSASWRPRSTRWPDRSRRQSGAGSSSSATSRTSCARR